MKIIVEPSAICAVRSNSRTCDRCEGRRVGIILTAATSTWRRCHGRITPGCSVRVLSALELRAVKNPLRTADTTGRGEKSFSAAVPKPRSQPRICRMRWAAQGDTLSRADSPMRSRSAESAPALRIARVKSSTSCDLVIDVGLVFHNSLGPPESETTTGKPHACASRMTFPKVIGCARKHEYVCRCISRGQFGTSEIAGEKSLLAKIFANAPE